MRLDSFALGCPSLAVSLSRCPQGKDGGLVTVRRARAVHTFAPRNSRRHLGCGENAEPRIRRGGGGRVPSRRGPARRCRGRWQQCRPPRQRGAALPGRDRDNGRRMGQCGRPRRGQRLLRFPVPGNWRRAAGSWRFHPRPGSNSDTSDLSSCCQCTRWNRKEGGGELRAASFVSVPRPPIPEARCSLPCSGLWPCLVLLRALCVGRGEEGTGEAKCTKITGRKRRVSLYQA